MPSPKDLEKAAFIEWYFDFNRQGTQLEWAASHGINQATLSHWKKSPEYVDRQNAYRTLFKPEFVEATVVMLKLAIRGNVRAYRAVAEVLGENAPTKVDVTGRMGLLEWLGSTQPATAAESRSN